MLSRKACRLLPRTTISSGWPPTSRKEKPYRAVRSSTCRPEPVPSRKFDQPTDALPLTRAIGAGARTPDGAAGAPGTPAAGGEVGRAGGEGAASGRGAPPRKDATRSPTLTARVSFRIRHEDECSATNATSSSATVCPRSVTASRSPTEMPAARPADTYTDVAER
jgi:hypothetical protein